MMQELVVYATLYSIIMGWILKEVLIRLMEWKRNK